MKRIIAIDLGNKFSGYVIADIFPSKEYEIVHFDVIKDTSKNHNVIMSKIIGDISPLVRCMPEKSVVLLEKLNWYPNWNLIRLNKCVRKYFTSELGITCLSQSPRQKTKIPERNHKERKRTAIKVAKDLLPHCLLDKFKKLERQHDVADAFLSIKYFMMQ